jgi:hypothetical protein
VERDQRQPPGTPSGARDAAAATAAPARWRDSPEIRLTLVLLAGGLPLIAAGAAGVAASATLVAGLLALAAALAVIGTRVAGTAWARVDRRAFVADLWVGPLLAGLLLVLHLDAHPGEVQALGGLVGLAGMLNYFLRPVYHLAYAFLSRARRR